MRRTLTGLVTTAIQVDIGYSRVDLALELQRRPDGLDGYFEYDLDLFDDESIGAFIDALSDLLHQVLVDPDIPILAVAVPSVSRPRGRPSGRPGPRRGRRRAESGDDLP